MIFRAAGRRRLILRDLQRIAVCWGIWRAVSSIIGARVILIGVQEKLLSQVIYGLVPGYEDLEDHDHLRRDPVHD